MKESFKLAVLLLLGFCPASAQDLLRISVIDPPSVVINGKEMHKDDKFKYNDAVI